VNNDSGSNFYTDFIPSRLTVDDEQERVYSAALKKLAREAPASLVLLVDRNGTILHTSDPDRQREMSELGALLAGDLAANEEIARLTGTLEEQQIILREGRQRHSFISEAGPHLVIFVQTASDVPLGWSRLLVQEAAEEIAALFPMETPPTPSEAGKDAPQEPEANAEIEQAIDELWKN
jgi:predicted regulator of Ras-like GTPase activity (Roadblock/LC7/MglB family)